MGDSKDKEDCPKNTDMAGKADQCKGCPSAKICAEKTVDPSISTIQKKLGHFDLILAVLSGKGGVGKSTISRNISESLSRYDLPVLLLDLDLSGPSIPKLTNTEDKLIVETNKIIYPVRISENLGTISVGHLQDIFEEDTIFSSSLKTNIIKSILLNMECSKYKVLIIDTPPNITDEHLGLVNFIKPNSAIIVTTPQTISLQDVIRQISFCRKTKISIFGLLENMKTFTCSHCGAKKDIFFDSNVKEIIRSMGIDYLGSIPLDLEIGKVSDKGGEIENGLFTNLSKRMIEHFNLK